MVDDLNSLKIIGSAELQERPIEEVFHLFFILLTHIIIMII
jgi:hypothetical protein